MRSPAVKIGAITYALLVKAMLDGVYTCIELAQETGLHYGTVLNYTREMHKAGAAHICRWEPDIRGRHLIRVYKIGAGKDAKRFKLTHAERQARVRAKHKNMALLKMMAGNMENRL